MVSYQGTAAERQIWSGDQSQSRGCQHRLLRTRGGLKIKLELDGSYKILNSHLRMSISTINNINKINNTMKAPSLTPFPNTFIHQRQWRSCRMALMLSSCTVSSLSVVHRGSQKQDSMKAVLLFLFRIRAIQPAFQFLLLTSAPPRVVWSALAVE